MFPPLIVPRPHAPSFQCPRCVAEITFKTDLKNCDYEMEHGATRNFMAQTLIKREEAALKEEKANEVLDPMTVLENRSLSIPDRYLGSFIS